MALGNASLTLSKFQVWSGTFLSLVAAENDISLSSIPRYLTVFNDYDKKKTKATFLMHKKHRKCI